jgi:hypothetical protein
MSHLLVKTTQAQPEGEIIPWSVRKGIREANCTMKMAIEVSDKGQNT